MVLTGRKEINNQSNCLSFRSHVLYENLVLGVQVPAFLLGIQYMPYLSLVDGQRLPLSSLCIYR